MASIFFKMSATLGLLFETFWLSGSGLGLGLGASGFTGSSGLSAGLEFLATFSCLGSITGGGSFGLGFGGSGGGVSGAV
jgi:hypothetical protein